MHYTVKAARDIEELNKGKQIVLLSKKIRKALAAKKTQITVRIGLKVKGSL